MSYQNLTAQIERHRTNPDEEKIRRGVVDQMLFKTRGDSTASAASELRAVATSGTFHSPAVGDIKIGAGVKRKLRALANKLMGIKAKPAQRKPHVKVKPAAADAKKKK